MILQEMINVGARIRYFREKKGITVNKLATMAGVSQSHLRLVELEEKGVTVEFLFYICDALGITLSAFFSEGETPDKLTLALLKLSPAQRSRLADFLDAL